jgi:TonB family protein
MRETAGPVLEEVAPSAAELRLLVTPESWSRVFVQNLRELLRPPATTPLPLQSSSGKFWPDVFVDRSLPWRRFLESGGCHVLALAAIWAASRLLWLQPQVTSQPAFTHADVVYYSPEEYLPPLDTRQPSAARSRKADPEFSAQPIISLPPDADNRSQTIVTAPNVKLQHDIPLPNAVAWSDKPRLPIAPAPAVPASEISRIGPRMERSIIAPPAAIDKMESVSPKFAQAPDPSIIAPPPAIDAGDNRRIGEINVGRSAVIAPAPQLSLDAQRSVSGGRTGALRGHASQVIAPPPSVGASGGSRSGGTIALSLHPAVGAPPAPVAGNRRGSFATTPEGHRGASGSPGNSASASNASGGGDGKAGAHDLPSGLYVGKNSGANSVNPNLIADARPTRLSSGQQRDTDSKLSEAERAVFGGRKVYSLSLNMPNLNSGGGSWIIRFAAIKPDSVQPGASSTDSQPADLSSPVAMRKIDPAYPLELMRQNVGGTVILYGIIHSDGSVGSVRILRRVDDRLDQFASEAIARWKFQPATKNGSPVDVEATFWIPFHPTRVRERF